MGRMLLRGRTVYMSVLIAMVLALLPMSAFANESFDNMYLPENIADINENLDAEIVSSENLIAKGNNSFVFEVDRVKNKEEDVTGMGMMRMDSQNGDQEDLLMERSQIEYIVPDRESYKEVEKLLSSSNDQNGNQSLDKISRYSAVKLYSTLSYKLRKKGNVYYTKLYSVYGGYVILNKNAKVSNQVIQYGIQGFPMDKNTKFNERIVKKNNSRFWSYHAPSNWAYLAPADIYRYIGVNHTVTINYNGKRWSETLQNYL